MVSLYKGSVCRGGRYGGGVLNAVCNTTKRETKLHILLLSLTSETKNYSPLLRIGTCLAFARSFSISFMNIHIQLVQFWLRLNAHNHDVCGWLYQIRKPQIFQAIADSVNQRWTCTKRLRHSEVMMWQWLSSVFLYRPPVSVRSLLSVTVRRVSQYERCTPKITNILFQELNSLF